MNSRTWWAIPAAATILIASGCSGSGGSNALSNAFCSDLRSGMSAMQILGPRVSDGTYTAKEAADRAYAFAALSCPEQLKSNAALRAYLQGWNINPDA